MLLPSLLSIREKYASALKGMMKRSLEANKNINDFFCFVVNAVDPETDTWLTLEEWRSEAEFSLSADLYLPFAIHR